jgi:hypothetical protein
MFDVSRTAGNLILMTPICVAIFIAVMAVRPAPAAELSRQMLGSWCGQWGWQFPDFYATGMWWRTEDVEGCGNRGGVRVRKLGYEYYRFGPQGSCTLTAIRFRRHGKALDVDLFVPRNNDGEVTEEPKAKARAGPRPSDVSRIRATCKAGGETWNESYDIQTANYWLKLSPVIDPNTGKPTDSNAATE